MNPASHPVTPGSRPLRRRRGKGGFLLLEILLAVLIFTVGVIALGRCLSNCLNGQEIRNQEERARLALENRMIEIQVSPVLPDEFHRDRLKGMFDGLTMIERRRTLDVKNEDNVALPDLHEITLTVEWTTRNGQAQSRSVAFNLLRGRG